VRAAIYARVSTEAQEQRGTIGSQLDVLRAKVAAAGDELVAELCDDGYSGARLDRPSLDALRDKAEAGVIEVVWCLSPDRLARSYAYQVLILDEFARFGVPVHFADAPPFEDDPQARLLVQVQGVIAEYEKAKIAERNRRGKLWRSKMGEVISWRAPYGYRRVSRSAEEAAHLVVFEQEAAVVRRVFDDYVSGGCSIREICRRLDADRVPSPTGKTWWGPSMVSRLLGNEAYVGRVYFNRTEAIPASSPTRRARTVKRSRPREEWISISCTPVVTDEVFEAAQAVSRDNSKWSPRNLKEDAWLLRGLVVCGVCHVGTNCLKRPGQGRDGTAHRYYRCSHADALRVGGEARRCRERNIRADALDNFVFEQLRAALLSPETLHAGEAAHRASTPPAADELLGAELARLEGKLGSNEAERRRLADLYQAGLLELTEVQQRARDIDARHRALAQQRDHLAAERQQLAVDNQLSRRVGDFARGAAQGIDQLDFAQRQQLLRLLVEHVEVTGWRVEIQLRIPLGEDPGDGHDGGQRPRSRSPRRTGRRPALVSSDDGLRSAHRVRLVLPVRTGPRRHLGQTPGGPRSRDDRAGLAGTGPSLQPFPAPRSSQGLAQHRRRGDRA